MTLPSDLNRIPSKASGLGGAFHIALNGVLRPMCLLDPDWYVARLGGHYPGRYDKYDTLCSVPSPLHMP
jgi:hypothetical protein